MTPSLSIIIVHYKVEKEILACLESITKSKPKIPYEIIIVDNDETDELKRIIKRKFPLIRYIKSPHNVGFGAANNIGAKAAKGEYLFFLNPDTEIYKNTLETLIHFFKKKKDTAVVAPLLHGLDGKPYPQGARELTPARAFVVLSFLNKYFPNNPISRKYFLKEWDMKNIQEADVSPGTAMMMQKKLFEDVGGFDEKFFLYFEEFDLCKRVRAMGGKIFILPTAKATHAWGMSTKHRTDIDKVFAQSRYYYFKKNFGIISAIAVEVFLHMNKYTGIVFVSLLVGAFLSLYKIEETLSFIGDYGWFYLSAKDFVLHGEIPLVGIASSHPWLHQGALWTYMLAPVLWVSSFWPISGVYLTVGLFLISIVLLYTFSSEVFNRRVGVIASVFYATSPLIILSAREPYHTSPIPLFTIIYFYALYKWVHGVRIFFPLIILLLALLYNLEIATFLLTIVFIITLIYGLIKKTPWFKAILVKKILLFSIAAFVVPMLPMIWYDLGHGFPQTFKFLAWVGYKIAVIFGYPPLHPEMNTTDYSTVLAYLGKKYQQLLYPQGVFVAGIIALLSFGYLFINILKQLQTKQFHSGILFLGLVFIISIMGIIATKTTSDAYLPILFPIIILITAVFFERLFQNRTGSSKIIVFVIALIAIMNTVWLTEQNYLTPKGYSFIDRVQAAKEIISQADGSRYNLKGKGPGSQFESFTMNYEYLTFWLGNPPSKNNEKKKIFISEERNDIKVIQENKDD